MAVTKRLRYEILRRDNHTCRYCGASAPDVKLTVDHVIPQALGGSDDPANLVTACEPCNSGKTSIPADAPIVANVADDALRWAAAIDRAAELAHEKYQVRLAYRDTFRQAWDDWKTGPEQDKAVPLDVNWETSLDNFYEAGLPDWELTEAVRAAMTNQKVAPDNTFRYFAGICWTKIRNMQDQARQILDAQKEHAGQSVDAQLVGDIAARWLASYREACDRLSIDYRPELDEMHADRARKGITRLLEQGYSRERVAAAAEEAGRAATFALTDYLGGWGNFTYDAMTAWASAWHSVDPENKWWRTSVPGPGSWDGFATEVQGAVAAGHRDEEILAACKASGEQQSPYLFCLSDWEGRWED